MTIEITVPDIGDFKDVPVIEVHVGPGQRVAAEEPLITLESDKATLEVPAPRAGTVQEMRVKVGDRVSQGSLVLLLEPEGVALRRRRSASPRMPPPPRRSRPPTAPPPGSMRRWRSSSPISATSRTSR